MSSGLAAKRRSLDMLVRDMRRVVIAYSGGVDSAFLTAACHEVLGRNALAITAVSPSLARRQLDEAKNLAAERGWNHVVVGTHEVAREEYARNDQDRCYWCKTELFDVLRPIARDRAATVAVGTNSDDLGDFRPGQRAAEERNVRAPLAEVGLSKDEVRALSRAIGLPTADKPASPCLASRFAYGVRVTPEGLRRVERAEEIVRALGFTVLRVRDHGDVARVEVSIEDVARAAELHGVIAAQLTALGWRFVTLDPGGFRSGSLNAVIPEPGIRRSETRGAPACGIGTTAGALNKD